MPVSRFGSGSSSNPGLIGRRFVLLGGLGAGIAWGLPESYRIGPLLSASPRRRAAKAEAVIHIVLGGGLSHLDSWDPKPYAPMEVRGDFGTAATAIKGEFFAEPLGRCAKIAGELAVIRSFTHGEAAHERASHSVLTGHPPLPAITYPSLGSVTSHEIPGRNNLPAYIAIPSAGNEYLGTGYLGAAYAPFSVGGEPNSGGFQVRDLEPPKGLEGERMARRRRMLAALDGGYEPANGSDSAAAVEAFYEQAYGLIESPAARAAFDIKSETKEQRDRYGRTPIGQRILLARRLAAAGARYVVVTDGGYDHHSEIFRNLRVKLDALDLGLSALISDLKETGLLSTTLVLVTSEFGRTSVVNKDRGRDHWPKVFSVVLAGGGIRGGVIHGASTATGTEPDQDPVSPADLAATVFTLLGIDPGKRLMSPGDRPLEIVREGKPVAALLGGGA